MRHRVSKLHLAILVAATLVGLTTWYSVAAKSAAEVAHTTPGESPLPTPTDVTAVRVETVKPVQGAIERTTNQPGSVIAFESARLFAKMSGYLKSQSVDIGDRVKRGQVLAVIDAPELIRDVEVAEATLHQSKAQVAQAEARVSAEKAAHQAAVSAIAEAEAELGHTEAVKSFREKQYNRIKGLFDLKSIDERLVDEKLDQWESATAADRAAHASVVSSKALAAAAFARVAQAQADVNAARSAVAVADAEFAKAKVLAEYLQIVSPYDGVITERNFFRGDFISAADQASDKPLLAVARTDVVRIVVQVPDDDVPLLDVNDPADITIDALRGQAFHGKVSRFANAEDGETRLMRAEIDLPNPKNALHPGMYGGVIIHLSPNEVSLSVPSAALRQQTGNGTATVYVVKDGQAQLRRIRVGKDNGAQIEVVDGLTPNDHVIVSESDHLADGMAVTMLGPDMAGRPPQSNTEHE